MEVYEISPAVNHVANDSPDLIEPYTAPPEPPTAVSAPRARAKPKQDTGQGSLF